MSAASPLIVFIAAQADTFTIFRGPLIKKMLASGYRVTALAADDDSAAAAELAAWGVPYESLGFARAGVNAWQDVLLFWRMIAVFRRLQPDILLTSQIKPVLYGLVAARLAGIPRRYALVTGLGYAFIEGGGWTRKIVRRIAAAGYSLAMQCATAVMFQNSDDRDYFRRENILPANAYSDVVNGSGVDMEAFAQQPLPPLPITFLMIARLVRDKGVYEFVEAARIVKREHPEAHFRLIGPFAPNPSAVQQQEVSSWSDTVEYIGKVRDVRPYLARCHVFVLPSYREGISKSACEAMAVGRPILTTDAPGCYQTVEEGKNGYIVPARDSAALAKAMEKLIATPEFLAAAGAESRAIAARKFDAHVIADRMMEIMGLVD